MLDSSLLPMENARARIRTMHQGDAAAYVEGTEDDAVRAYAHLPEERYTVELVDELIAGAIREGLDRGDLAVLAIADVPSDDFVGSLVIFDVTAETAEVGFWLHPRGRGGGIATAALELGVAFVRDSGIPRLAARTAPDNIASRKVLLRASFDELGTEDGVAPSGHRVQLTRFERILEKDGAERTPEER